MAAADVNQEAAAPLRGLAMPPGAEPYPRRWHSMSRQRHDVATRAVDKSFLKNRICAIVLTGNLEATRSVQTYRKQARFQPVSARSEATKQSVRPMDCFASLAMTARRRAALSAFAEVVSFIRGRHRAMASLSISSLQGFPMRLPFSAFSPLTF